MALKNLYVTTLYSKFESPQKFLHKCLFKIPLWRELITSFLIFQFLVNVWSENSISIPIDSGITNFSIWLFGGDEYQGGDEAEARGTDNQPLIDKPLSM